MTESSGLSITLQQSPITHGAQFGNLPGPAGASTAIEPLIALLLDEIGHGVILLRDGGKVVHLNHAAQQEIRTGRSVAIVDGNLCACRARDGTVLGDALAGARRGLRKLVRLGIENERVAVALIPIGDAQQCGGVLTAAVFARRQLCERISVQWFARAHGLTQAESKVLELLCDGLDPSDIAQANAVGMATVRTQVQAIRLKVGVPSIRRLLDLVAMLPPMVSALRN